MWVFFKNMSIAPLGKDIMQGRRKMRCIYAAHLQVCFVERPMPTDQAALDAFDIAILRILQQDNTTPQRTIGEAVNLSAPAVQRRIKRMEQNGVIRQNTALLDPARVG